MANRGESSRGQERPSLASCEVVELSAPLELRYTGTWEPGREGPEHLDQQGGGGETIMKNRRRGPGEPEVWGPEGSSAGGWEGTGNLGRHPQP